MAKKALIIANKIVFPTLDGGALAMNNLTMLLKKNNYIIDIVCIEKNNTVKNTSSPIFLKKNDQIKQITFQKNMQLNLLSFIESIIKKKAYQSMRFYDRNIKNFIQKLINKNNYQTIIFESIFTTIYLNKLEFKKTTKTILRAHNVEHKIWEDLAKNKTLKKFIFLFLATQIQKIENKIPKYLDYIFTLSKIDETYFKNRFPKKTFNIPVTFQIKNKTEKKIKNSIFHLGSMDWKPNQEGVDWFLKNVRPTLEKQNIKIFIAGKNMPKQYFNYKNENTIIEGRIKNAEAYIKNKEILFVPLFSGSGIRIKILEAMALGIPVVSTSKGAQGIPFTNGENILIADNSHTFKQAIIDLIKNKNLAKKISDNGKKLITTYFSDKVVINKLKKML